MGLLNSFMSKVGNAMEESMSKNLTGESKEAYEKEKAEKLQKQAEKEKNQAAEKEELASHRLQISKNDLGDLQNLLEKIKVIDEKKLWVGGLDNFKQNQNAKVANLFSGNKNVKIISLLNDVFYFSKFQDEVFYAYKSFTKEQIASVETEGLLNKKLKIKLKDNTAFSIDVTENKDKLDELKIHLK